MAVKLKDIATELNLSVSTVSRVATGKDRIHPDTRMRVLEALEHHNYRPNEIARSLRLRTAKTIVIVVPDIANNFYASIIKGAQAVCRERSYSLMVCNTDERKDLEHQVIAGLPMQIAGIILASTDSSAKLVQHFKKIKMPVVFVDNIPPATQSYDSVTINNVAAAYTLTKKMIKRGYKHIGLITGTLDQSSASERLEGYKNALQDSGIAYDDTIVANGDFKIQSGYDAMNTLLNIGSKIDAVIASNNFMGYGAIRAIKEAGMSIPRDIAMAAFDFVDETELLSPKITSINQPAAEIGVQSARILMKRITAKNDLTHTNLLLDTFFLPGDSW